MASAFAKHERRATCRLDATTGTDVARATIMTAGLRSETARVESFSDGVFAISITLLSLGLKAPISGNKPLATILLSSWPRFLAFATSFVTIGFVWINHHRLFTHIHRVSHGLLMWNGLLLMSVALFPFTNDLLAEFVGHDGARTAAATYAMCNVFSSASFALLWRHATGRAGLLDRHISDETIRRITRQYQSGPLLYLCSFALAFVSALASIALDVLLAAYFAIPAYAIADAHVAGSPLAAAGEPANESLPSV